MIQREHWAKQWGFIWVMAGSAIGLGNIWRFPYLVGKYGGGAFLLLYVICLAVFGLPMLLSELAIGRAAQANPVDALGKLSKANPAGAKYLAGLVGMFGCGVMLFYLGYGLILLGLAFLIYRYGWATLAYVYIFGGLLFLGLYATTSGFSFSYLGLALCSRLSFALDEGSFWKFIGTPLPAVISVAIYLFCCALIVWFGIRKGIERVSQILVPLMIPLLAGLVILASSLPGSAAGWKFFLYPDFSKINLESVLAALGQCMLSLSLGMGIAIAFGSYLKREVNLLRTTVIIAGMDLLVSLLAGMMIFPAAYAVGIASDSGPGLIFETIPRLISHFGSTWVYPSNIAFFLMLSIAAVTSGIGSLEVAVLFFSERSGLSRRAIIVLCIVPVFLIGSLSAYGGLNWKRLPLLEKMLKFLFGDARESLFMFLDHMGGCYYLPLGGLLIMIFAAWIWGADEVAAEVFPARPANRLFVFGIKYFVPFVLLILFIQKIVEAI